MPSKDRENRGSLSKYAIRMEVAGPLAMFARPDTGVTPTSYPVPTWSACKGILECIALLSSGDAWICPTKVQVCRRHGTTGGAIFFQRYTTNYGGPLRKAKEVKSGAGFQFFANALADVCYRIQADIRRGSGSARPGARHHLQDLFNRRLEKGQCYQTPSLGWREFTCSYWGPFREGEYEVDTDINLTIPSMLVGVWSAATTGIYAPRFVQNAIVRAGELDFAE